VAAIERVKNPVKVARAVLHTPHILLVGDGATRFARSLGHADYDPATPQARAKTAELVKKLVAKDPSLPPGWVSFDWRSRWNFEKGLAESGLDAGHDTVGVAVRAADGRFAVALSTGGTTVTLRGRVGDVPIMGAGLFAGAHGAAAATGTGERIVEANLARRVHDWLAEGESAALAARRAADELRGKDIGVVVISKHGMSAAADRPMAWAARESGSTVFLGP
jgi:isoaspartyl peptidase/L-asparaginase-like protein (Ntn-hydrolase superfamily)